MKVPGDWPLAEVPVPTAQMQPGDFPMIVSLPTSNMFQQENGLANENSSSKCLKALFNPDLRKVW